MALHKFTAGFAAPRHTHSASTKIVVTCGTRAMAGEDGKEMTFPPGSCYARPNACPHVTQCPAGSDCLVYPEADARGDLRPVETKQ